MPPELKDSSGKTIDLSGLDESTANLLGVAIDGAKAELRTEVEKLGSTIAPIAEGLGKVDLSRLAELPSKLEQLEKSRTTATPATPGEPGSATSGGEAMEKIAELEKLIKEDREERQSREQAEQQKAQRSRAVEDYLARKRPNLRDQQKADLREHLMRAESTEDASLDQATEARAKFWRDLGVPDVDRQLGAEPSKEGAAEDGSKDSVKAKAEALRAKLGGGVFGRADRG